jgi:hypothetical protein
MTNQTASQTYFGKNEPFELQVARGQIPGHSSVNIFGYQAVVGTGTPIAVWENTTAYTFPASAQNMLVYSSSASDTNCRIVITGLGENFLQVSEVVILTNGTTGVQTVNKFLRINGLLATDAVYANPVGNIIVGNVGKTAIYGQINAGIGKSQASVYSVPAGHTFYLCRVDAYANEAGSGNNYGNYRVSATDNVNGTTYIVLQSPFLGNYNARRVIPFPYTEKTDLQWQVSVGTSTSPVGVIIEGILIRSVS